MSGGVCTCVQAGSFCDVHGTVPAGPNFRWAGAVAPMRHHAHCATTPIVATEATLRKMLDTAAETAAHALAENRKLRQALSTLLDWAEGAESALGDEGLGDSQGITASVRAVLDGK